MTNRRSSACIVIECFSIIIVVILLVWLLLWLLLSFGFTLVGSLFLGNPTKMMAKMWRDLGCISLGNPRLANSTQIWTCGPKRNAATTSYRSHQSPAFILYASGMPTPLWLAWRWRTNTVAEQRNKMPSLFSQTHKNDPKFFWDSTLSAFLSQLLCIERATPFIN